MIFMGIVWASYPVGEIPVIDGASIAGAEVVLVGICMEEVEGIGVDDAMRLFRVAILETLRGEVLSGEILAGGLGEICEIGSRVLVSGAPARYHLTELRFGDVLATAADITVSSVYPGHSMFFEGEGGVLAAGGYHYYDGLGGTKLKPICFDGEVFDWYCTPDRWSTFEQTLELIRARTRALPPSNTVMPGWVQA